MPIKPEFQTVAEVASRFRVHPVTVYRLVKKGRLKSHRLGRKGIRIARADVERFIRESREWTPDEAPSNGHANGASS